MEAFMYKNIVVAVDGSETSNLALEESINLARDQRAKLCVIHVIDTAIAQSTDTGLVWFDADKFLASVRKEGQELLNKMETIAKASGVEVDGTIIENKDFSRVSEKILEATDRLKADLLVIGTHGRRGFHKFLLGSVAEEVIRSENIPVLLVKEKLSKNKRDNT